MKKKLLFLLIFPIIILTGCEDKESHVIASNNSVNKYEGKSGKATCILNTNTQSFDLKSTYNITYEDGIVSKTYVREIVDMKDEKYIADYVEKLKEEHEKYNDLEYYEYYINTSGTKVTSVNSIDYSKLDLEKLSEIMGKKVDKDNLKLNKFLATYKILGAKCEVE